MKFQLCELLYNRKFSEVLNLVSLQNITKFRTTKHCAIATFFSQGTTNLSVRHTAKMFVAERQNPGSLPHQLAVRSIVVVRDGGEHVPEDLRSSLYRS